MSQADLARGSKISASHISKIEHDQVDPTWGTTAQIAAALGVSMEYLAQKAEEYADV
jgi:transcriptional regulator with XRE-family HTH domain